MQSNLHSDTTKIFDRDTEATQAVSVVRHHDVDTGSYSLHYVRLWVFSQPSGMLCTHLTAAIFQYQNNWATFAEIEECLRERQLRILNYFGPYWKHDMLDFPHSPTLRHWEGAGLHMVSGVYVAVSECEVEWDPLIRLRGPVCLTTQWAIHFTIRPFDSRLISVRGLWRDGTSTYRPRLILWVLNGSLRSLDRWTFQVEVTVQLIQLLCRTEI